MAENPSNTPEDPDGVSTRPLWRIALRRLKELPTFGFGMQVDVEWFEQQLNEKFGTSAFGFAMMDICASLEDEPGYVLQRQTILDPETGKNKVIYKISSEDSHVETLGPKQKEKGARNTRRSLHIITKTLANPTAKLTEEQRTKADKEAQIVAQRLLFMQRQNAFVKTIKAHNPKLLKGDNTGPVTESEKVTGEKPASEKDQESEKQEPKPGTATGEKPVVEPDQQTDKKSENQRKPE